MHKFLESFHDKNQFINIWHKPEISNMRRAIDNAVWMLQNSTHSRIVYRGVTDTDKEWFGRSALAEGHGKIDILSLILITSHVLVQIGFSWREKKMLSRIMYGTKGQCQQKNDLVDLPQLRVVVKNWKSWIKNLCKLVFIGEKRKYTSLGVFFP